jgi:hypothetical protein
VHNPEQLVYNALRHAAVAVEMSDTWPVVDARPCDCDAHGVNSFWCPVDPSKDCWPSREPPAARVRPSACQPHACEAYAPPCEVVGGAAPWTAPCTAAGSRPAGSPQGDVPRCDVLDAPLASAIGGLMAGANVTDLAAGSGCYLGAYRLAGSHVAAAVGVHALPPSPPPFASP